MKVHEKGVTRPQRIVADLDDEIESESQAVPMGSNNLATQKTSKTQTQQLAILTRDRHIEKEVCDFLFHLCKKRPVKNVFLF